MFVLFVLALETLACLRVVLRLARTAGGAPIAAATAPPDGTIAVIVPVLDEAARLAPCLRALAASRGPLAEIVVVDGGSSDRTRDLVLAAAAQDHRLRLIDAGPAPLGWNGKAWSLERGLQAVDAVWVATVDADVRVGPTLISDAAARASRDGLAALSIATRQLLPDLGSALLHPALLTTLVYRAGLPNVATGSTTAVQANGQVFVARRKALVSAGAFRTARASRCEDVTTARAIAANGGRVGFYEGDAVVRMYDSWRDCVANWPRSLTLRDRFVPPARTWLALAELLFAQALPLPSFVLLLVAGDRVRAPRIARAIALALLMVRLGVLAGTRRAYPGVSGVYWLSPLADLPAVVLLARSALRRRQMWRGRLLVDESSA
jgi:dolichol-phosphate mannosyltransferase